MVCLSYWVRDVKMFTFTLCHEFWYPWPHGAKLVLVLLLTNSRWAAPMGCCLNYRWNTSDEPGSIRTSGRKTFLFSVCIYGWLLMKDKKREKREESTQTSFPNLWGCRSKRIHCWISLLTESIGVYWGLGTVPGRRWIGFLHFLED